jgi:serine protease Do
MSERPTGVIGIGFGTLKAVAILGGLPLSVLGLMAVVGLVSENVWVRLAVAAVVAIGVPLFIVDRLLPSDGSSKKGLATDVLALIWAGFALAFFGAAHSVTGAMTVKEADRLAADNYRKTARVAYWLASATPQLPKTTKKHDSNKNAAAAKTAEDKKTKDKKKADTKKPVVAKGKKTDAGPKPDAKAKKPAVAKKDGTRKTFTLPELFKTCAPSVVTIRTNRGMGTGFVIDDRGTVVTNHHVIRGGAYVRIKLKDGTYLDQVDLLIQDQKRDIAVLRAPGAKKLKALPLGHSDKIVVGQRVISIGNPLGLEHTLTDGVVSSRRVYRGHRWIQLTAPLSPGNSGGPVFNMQGEVVGISTAVIGFFQRGQNLNLAIPINDLRNYIKSTYPKRKSVGRTSSGGSQTW